jgi:hypothetical protein
MRSHPVDVFHHEVGAGENGMVDALEDVSHRSAGLIDPNLVRVIDMAVTTGRMTDVVSRHPEFSGQTGDVVTGTVGHKGDVCHDSVYSTLFFHIPGQILNQSKRLKLNKADANIFVMKTRLPMLLPLILGGILAGLLLWWLPRDWSAGWGSWAAFRGGAFAPGASRPPQEPGEKAGADTGSGMDFLLARQWADAADRILALLERRLGVEGARDHEAILTFKTEQAYRDFLARAAAAGLKVLDQMDGFRMVRVGYDELGALQRDLLANAADYGDVGANYNAYFPSTPEKEDRAAQNEVPFGDNMLPFLGVTGDHSQWGKGVTIAVLDSGVAADATFGSLGRVRYLDIGQGLLGNGEGDGHGTAVAGLAAGQSPDAMGVSPASDILSIKVTGADGTSDLFTLAKGIQKAVDAGSPVVIISLGSYQNSSVLTTAIDYASARGVVIVAASGNDQAAQMTWPAADPRVVSVGAVDASEQQATFSNSGEGLKFTAPGYGINTAWLNGERVVFDGTSASAPIVAGGVAAMLSENPGMTAVQAVEILQLYSSDGGAPGADPAYGSGILNLGWAMNRNDTTRVDTAVSSHYYNNQTGQMEFVIQNRSGSTVNGMNLYITESAGQLAYQIPPLNPGASTTVSIPVNQIDLSRAVNGLSYRSQLLNPNNVTDVLPVNNQRASTVSKQ